MKTRMKLNGLIFTVAFAFCELVYAQSTSCQWASSASGSGLEESRGVSIDAEGNTYITGNFSSPTMTFGGDTLTNSGFTNQCRLVKKIS